MLLGEAINLVLVSMAFAGGKLESSSRNLMLTMILGVLWN